MTRTAAKRRSGRRGYVLLFGLVMTGMLVVLGAAMLALASTSLRTSTRRTENAQALNLAMGGLDEAISQLKLSSSYTGFASRPLGAGTVAATVAASGTRRTVVATGTIVGSNHTVVRRCRAVMDEGATAPVFYRALAAKTSFTINGDVDVTSGPSLHVGDVHANQNVNLVGSAVLVDGNVTASGRVTTSGSPSVTGTMTSGVPPMAFPDVDQAFKDKSLVNGTTPGSVSASDGRLVQGKIAGDLTIGPPLGARISGVVWVTGTVTISGPVTGTGTIVSDGNLVLSAAATYAASDVSKLAFITTSADPVAAVDLGGDRQFKGIIYAPYGTVKLHGTPALLGQVVANAVTFSGTPDITRLTDVDDNPPPLPRLLTVKGWEEL